MPPCAQPPHGLIGRAPPPIGIRDPKARWGSCSADGRLSFSWRLIMAPPTVLDYVVAHEVAHLRHLNHGAKFKATLAGLAANEAEAQDWLGRAMSETKQQLETALPFAMEPGV